MIGAKLGTYEILSKLGEGGMGEVYRARDTRLNRDVAIKVLPAAFAIDPERVARFEREAQMLAALNHPNIAHVHGVVEQPLALVMECVEGEDLAQRIARGPLPIDDALAIARQIATALAAAHEQGIIHRDLKPANIKVSPDGTVKVLDFGLAKAVTRDESAADLANSPTFSNLPQMTQMGVILGTAAYMSPEQARGKRVDQRTDLWSFGCVMYEMLSGRKPFDGEDDSVATVLARILEREPDYTALPLATPASIRRLIRRCLEKNPARRLASAHDAGLEIDDMDVAAQPVSVPAGRRTAGAVLPWIAIVLALALAGTSVALWRATRPSPGQVMRYDIQLPSKGSLSLTQWPPLAISPDGTTVVFAVGSEGGTQLFLRRRGEAVAKGIPGTEDATSPVFSPDGRWLLFATGRDLKKMMIGSGPASIAEVGGASRGATWLEDGSIVYSPDATTPLLRIPSGGGAAQPLTTMNTQKGERSHRWPVALPGGKAVLFIVGLNSSPDDYNNADVDAVIVATGERRHVLAGASFVEYASGHLLFMRNGSINAVPFDVDSLTVTGTPVPVVDGVAGDVTTGAAAFACAQDGTLVYAAGASGANGNMRRLVWADRTGAVEPLSLPTAFYNDQRMSPDGSRFAVVDGASGSGDVWIYDVARKTFTRLTFEKTIATPVWSPDGRSVLYASIDAASGRTTFYRKPVDGSRDQEKLATVDGRSFLLSVNPAGDRLMIVKTTGTQARVADILSLSIRDGVETPLVATSADEYSGSPSADGRWLAYESNESGRYEVYVRDLREGGGRWQISTAGGEEPRWSADGRALFFRIDDRLMQAKVAPRDSFEAETPTKLFDGIFNVRSDTGVSYDVDPKTGRFLMTRPADLTASASVSSLNVVINWFEELRRLAR